jgi:hypothetical protein
MGSRAILDIFGEQKNLLPLPEIIPQFLGQLYRLCQPGAQCSTNELLISYVWWPVTTNSVSKLLIRFPQVSKSPFPHQDQHGKKHIIIGWFSTNPFSIWCQVVTFKSNGKSYFVLFPNNLPCRNTWCSMYKIFCPFLTFVGHANELTEVSESLWYFVSCKVLTHVGIFAPCPTSMLQDHFLVATNICGCLFFTFTANSYASDLRTWRPQGTHLTWNN